MSAFKMEQLFKLNPDISRGLQNQSRDLKIIRNVIAICTMGLFLIISLYPEISLAVSLDEQLTKVSGIANGTFKTVGLASATIGGGIWSVVKGNIKLTGIIIAIGVTLSLYLEWISSGMVI